jgi:Ni/Co efflux regulator RcnB
MKMPKRLIAGLGILMIGASPLLQAAPGPSGPGGPDEQRQGGQQQHQQPQQQQGHGGQQAQHGNGNGNGNGPQKGGQRPPQDFGPVRQTIHDNRDSFGRGNPPPPGIRVVKGQPLPHGYGKRLDNRALAHLPHYQGYEWRRMGTDVVLIAIGTGIVYEVLQGVLN